MEKLNDVGKSKAEVFRDLVEKAPRRSVSFGSRRREPLRFAAVRTPCQLSQQRLGFGLDRFPNPGIDGPAGASVFENCSVAVEADVADLGFARFGAVINPAIHDQATPNAAAQGDVENRTKADASPVKGFAERCGVRVVFDAYW